MSGDAQRRAINQALFTPPHLVTPSPCHFSRRGNSGHRPDPVHLSMSTTAAIAVATWSVAKASQYSPSNQSRIVSREQCFAAEKSLDFQAFSAAVGPAGSCAEKNAFGGCAAKYGIATTLRSGRLFEFLPWPATGNGSENTIALKFIPSRGKIKGDATLYLKGRVPFSFTYYDAPRRARSRRKMCVV
jgi:hypothetical protein